MTNFTESLGLGGGSEFLDLYSGGKEEEDKMGLNFDRRHFYN